MIFSSILPLTSIIFHQIIINILIRIHIEIFQIKFTYHTTKLLNRTSSINTSLSTMPLLIFPYITLIAWKFISPNNLIISNTPLKHNTCNPLHYPSKLLTYLNQLPIKYMHHTSLLFPSPHIPFPIQLPKLFIP